MGPRQPVTAQLRDAIVGKIEFAQNTDGYRTAVRTTQAKQDSVLRQYREISTIRAQEQGLLQEAADPESTVNDHVLFPEDDGEFIDAVAHFISCVPLISKPRSFGKTQISTRGFGQRASTMVFWGRRIRKSGNDCRAQITQRTKELVTRYSRETEVFDKESFERHPIGRDDLLYFIEEDSINATKDKNVLYLNTTSVNVHHLWMILMCTCGVRPGSLVGDRGSALADRHFMQWKDVSIYRYKHGFLAKVVFVWEKGNSDKTTLQDRKPVTMSFRTPTDPGMLSLSIPERLLAELVARDYLCDYRNTPEDIDRLLSSPHEYQIRIRPEALHEPVFAKWAGGAPLNSKEMNKYLQRRMPYCGLPPNYTTYSFRGQAGTIVDRKLGTSTAQKMMMHSVGSHTYHEHYDLGLDHFDPVGLIIDRDEGLFTELQGTSELPAMIFRVDYRDIEATMRQDYFAREKSFGGKLTEGAKKAIWADVLRTAQAKFAAEISLDTVEARKKQIGHSSLIPRLRKETPGDHSPDRNFYFKHLTFLATRVADFISSKPIWLAPPRSGGQDNQLKDSLENEVGNEMERAMRQLRAMRDELEEADVYFTASEEQDAMEIDEGEDALMAGEKEDAIAEAIHQLQALRNELGGTCVS